MNEMKKAVISVLGTDRKGIIARVSGILFDNDANILDISQTSTDDRIDMMMVVDIEGFQGSFRSLLDGLNAVGEEIGCSIKAQHEEIFDMMHRI